MSQPYGPAALLGILIGGAILLDDHLGPGAGHAHGSRVVELKSNATDPATPNVTIGETASLQRHKIVMAVNTEDASATGRTVEINVTAEGDEGIAQLPNAIAKAIDTAESEGRHVTKEDLESAIENALDGDAEHNITVIIDGETR